MVQNQSSASLLKLIITDGSCDVYTVLWQWIIVKLVYRHREPCFKNLLIFLLNIGIKQRLRFITMHAFCDVSIKLKVVFKMISILLLVSYK